MRVHWDNKDISAERKGLGDTGISIELVPNSCKSMSNLKTIGEDCTCASDLWGLVPELGGLQPIFPPKSG